MSSENLNKLFKMKKTENKKMSKKWDAKLVFEVDGGEGTLYRNTSEWIQEEPKKVALMEKILGEAQAKFVELASKVKA